MKMTWEGGGLYSRSTEKSAPRTVIASKGAPSIPQPNTRNILNFKNRKSAANCQIQNTQKYSPAQNREICGPTS
jgi:hypothetical protein